MSTIPTETQFDNIQIRANELKKSWHYWRNVILLLNDLLEWTNVFHSAVFFASLTLFFVLLYLLDPPILVVISILLLIFGLIYISGPLYVDSLELNYHDEKYSQIYQRIAYFEEFIRKQCQSIRQPSTTVDIVIGCVLVCLAFCGQWIDVFV